MSKTAEQKQLDVIHAMKQPTRKTRGAVKPGRVTVVKTERGKPVNMYMHPDDLERIRTLAAYLGMQGKRVSDSQVVKAALRVAKKDSDLLAAFEETEAIDQRFKRAKV